MFKLLSFLCICLVVRMAYSWEARLEKQVPPTKYTGLTGCYYDRFDMMLPANIYVRPIDGQCAQYLCQTDGETIIEGCGVVQATPECRPVEDFALPYPDCCLKYICPGEPGF